MEVLHSKQPAMVEGVDLAINDRGVSGIETYRRAIQDKALHALPSHPGTSGAVAIYTCCPQGCRAEAELPVRNLNYFRHSISASEFNLCVVGDFALVIFERIAILPDSQLTKQLCIGLRFCLSVREPLSGLKPFS